MTDLMYWFIGAFGLVLALIQFAMNDFDIEKTMYKEEQE